MGNLHGKVVKTLKESFPDIVVDGLEVVGSTGTVTGLVISSAFERLDDPERQSLLWGVLDKGLSTDELNSVGPIATLTPAEATIDISLDE